VPYKFSGPDFLSVDAFLPDRSTYVLSGLEPVGEIPTVTPALHRSLGSALAGLRASVGSALNYSFFITRQMQSNLRGSRLNGVLPVLYLFLARSGKTIHEVALIAVDKEGAVVAAGTRDAIPGVKIVFSGREGRMQTLYYLQTDLSDHGLSRSGFLKFCERLGISDAFLKSASYLLHSGNFARLRGFLLERTRVSVQDDSGSVRTSRPTNGGFGRSGVSEADRRVLVVDLPEGSATSTGAPIRRPWISASGTDGGRASRTFFLF
jgi:hypothetical protein